MAKLKQIKGTRIQFRDTDPVVYVGAWSSGTDINTSRRLIGASGVSNSSGLVFGGRTPAPAKTGATEEYNGTTWTEKADLDQARDYIVGAGTQTAALAIGGSTSTSTTNGYTESFNGSAWSEVNALTRGPSSPQSTTYGAASGSNTSALFYASDETSSANARTESWDGSNWTEVADQNTARSYGVGVGTSNSGALLIGGLGSPSNPGFIANVEEWNGTSWTEISDINTVRIQASGSMQGSTESTIYFGGRTPPATSSALTENWNGTAWTEIADLATARRGSGGSGVGTSAFIAGGQTSPSGSVTTTEEWSFPSTPVVQEGDMWFNGALKGHAKSSGIPSGVWSAGGTMNTSREQGADFGSLTAGVAAGSGNTNVEEYNGTSWAEVNDIPSSGAAGGATGTQTAGIAFGYINPNSADTTTYNGTTWTEVNNLNSGRNVGGSAGGLQTSALYAGGSSSVDSTEIWDGTSWTEVNNLNDGRYYLKGGGTTTAAVLAGGYGGSPSTNPAQSETWDGTSWTEGNNLNTGRAFLTGGGSEFTSVMVFGGGPPVIDSVEYWNGTSWTEMNDMATASETSHGTTQGTGVGTYRARTPAGGATEEWTVTAATVTVTTS
jgi:hypothetical protein